MDKSKLNKMLRDYGMENILGGGLAKILSALLDTASEKEMKSISITIPNSDTTESTAEGFAELLGITVDELTDIFAGGYMRVIDQAQAMYQYIGGMNGKEGYYLAAFAYGQSSGGIVVMTLEFSPKGNRYIYSTHLAQYNNA